MMFDGGMSGKAACTVSTCHPMSAKGPLGVKLELTICLVTPLIEPSEVVGEALTCIQRL